jgi:hypothetical protein
VTAEVGIAELVESAKAGRVCQPSGQGLAESLDQVEREWSACSKQARRLAERYFSSTQFLGTYGRLYEELL